MGVRLSERRVRSFLCGTSCAKQNAWKSRTFLYQRERLLVRLKALISSGAVLKMDDEKDEAQVLSIFVLSVVSCAMRSAWSGAPTRFHSQWMTHDHQWWSDYEEWLSTDEVLTNDEYDQLEDHPRGSIDNG